MTTLASPMELTRIREFEPAGRRAYRLHISPDVGRDLDRHISVIIKEFREALGLRDEPRSTERHTELILDLSDVSEVPHSSLVLLANLLRRALGEGATVTLQGLKPMILSQLTTFALPSWVVIRDARQRRWSGSA